MASIFTSGVLCEPDERRVNVTRSHGEYGAIRSEGEGRSHLGSPAALSIIILAVHGCGYTPKIPIKPTRIK